MTVLAQTPCDVDFLEFVESRQYTSTGHTTENVGTCSLHKAHESLCLNDCNSTVNGALVLNGLPGGHHHTSSDCVNGVGHKTSTDCYNVSQCKGGHETSSFSQHDGLECVVEAEVATSVHDDSYT